MKDEAWLKRIKDNLQDYSEPLPRVVGNVWRVNSPVGKSSRSVGG